MAKATIARITRITTQSINQASGGWSKNPRCSRIVGRYHVALRTRKVRLNAFKATWIISQLQGTPEERQPQQPHRQVISRGTTKGYSKNKWGKYSFNVWDAGDAQSAP